MLNIVFGSNGNDVFLTAPNTFEHYFCLGGDDQIFIQEKFDTFNMIGQPAVESGANFSTITETKNGVPLDLKIGQLAECLGVDLSYDDSTPRKPSVVNDWFWVMGGGTKTFNSTVPIDDPKFDEFVIVHDTCGPIAEGLEGDFGPDYRKWMHIAEDEVASIPDSEKKPLHIHIDLTVSNKTNLFDVDYNDSGKGKALVNYPLEFLLGNDFGREMLVSQDTVAFYLKGKRKPASLSFESSVLVDEELRFATMVVRLDKRVFPKNPEDGSVTIEISTGNTGERRRVFSWNTATQDFDVADYHPPLIPQIPTVTDLQNVSNNALLSMDVIAAHLRVKAHNIAAIKWDSSSQTRGVWLLSQVNQSKFASKKPDDRNLHDQADDAKCVISTNGVTRFYNKDMRGYWNTSAPLIQEAAILTPVNAGTYDLEVTTVDNKSHVLTLSIQETHPTYVVNVPVDSSKPFHVYQALRQALKDDAQALMSLDQSAHFVWTLGKGLEPNRLGHESLFVNEKTGESYDFKAISSNSSDLLRQLVCQKLGSRSDNGWPVSHPMAIFAYSNKDPHKPVASYRVNFHAKGF